MEELEREAAELRRENGWLKEIVMLKSKRFGGQAPALDPNAPGAGGGGVAEAQSPSPTSKESVSSEDSTGGEKEPDDDASTTGKGKDVQR